MFTLFDLLRVVGILELKYRIKGNSSTKGIQVPSTLLTEMQAAVRLLDWWALVDQ